MPLMSVWDQTSHILGTWTLLAAGLGYEHDFGFRFVLGEAGCMQASRLQASDLRGFETQSRIVTAGCQPFP